MLLRYELSTTELTHIGCCFANYVSALFTNNFVSVIEFVPIWELANTITKFLNHLRETWLRFVSPEPFREALGLVFSLFVHC